MEDSKKAFIELVQTLREKPSEKNIFFKVRVDLSLLFKIRPCQHVVFIAIWWQQCHGDCLAKALNRAVKYKHCTMGSQKHNRLCPIMFSIVSFASDPCSYLEISLYLTLTFNTTHQMICYSACSIIGLPNDSAIHSKTQHF